MSKEFAVRPRFRVLIDNDFGGDPDGLVQLAHHLLSPTVEIPGIIVSHLRKDDAWAKGTDGIDRGIQFVNDLLDITGKLGIPVLRGSNDPMLDIDSPIDSEAVDFILKEINRYSLLPLFIVCGGSLTQVASAYLRSPSKFEDVTIVWIGGAEHDGIGISTYDAPQLEYNTHEDVSAAQVIFNKSDLTLWQVPRNTYRQALVSFAELDLRLKGNGDLGNYLRDKLVETINWWDTQGRLLGETYCLGDSPLVLLTALHTSYEPDPGSSTYKEISCPELLTSGAYKPNIKGRKIRVYDFVDTRLMFEDFFSKVTLLASR